MRQFLFIVFILLAFQACSFKSEPNQWQYNSTKAFSSYMKSFFEGKDELAKENLNAAIRYAKQSAILEQLQRVYLGECALNISVGINDKCSNYTNIKHLESVEMLEAYFAMLQNEIKEEQISKLPSQYRNFVKYKLEENYSLAFKSITNMSQISSQFIASSLIMKHLDKSQLKYLLKKASFYGYKKVVLFYLEKLKNIETQNQEKMKLQKRIDILKN